MEPYEPEEGGGLSGKTIALIGGAAGGAAFAVASGGSDEAGSIPPTGTTSIVPWQPSPGSPEPTFSIRADRRWESSGVNVAAGNRVRFRASGTVTIDNKKVSVGKIDEIVKKLLANNEHLVVCLCADDGAKYGDFVKALDQNLSNTAKTAASLGIPLRTLYRKIEKYRLL